MIFDTPSFLRFGSVCHEYLPFIHSFHCHGFVIVNRMFAFIVQLVSPSLYRRALAAIIVYDITNKSSFEAIPKWLHELDLHGPPSVVAVVGNKIDLESKRTVTKEMVEDLLAKRKKSGPPSVFIQQECSGKSGQGAHDVFEQICKILIQNALNSLSRRERVKLSKTHLAWLTLSGYEGIERNEVKAVKMLKERVKDKDSEAMWMLGLCKEFGMGTKQDIKGAETLFEQSREGGNKVGLFLRSKVGGRGTMVMKNSLLDSSKNIIEVSIIIYDEMNRRV